MPNKSPWPFVYLILEQLQLAVKYEFRIRSSRQVTARVARPHYNCRTENRTALSRKACRRCNHIFKQLNRLTDTTIFFFILVHVLIVIYAHTAEDNLNISLRDITVTGRDGRVSQLDQVYIRGSMIRFFIVPDMLQNAPM